MKNLLVMALFFSSFGFVQSSSNYFNLKCDQYLGERTMPGIYFVKVNLASETIRLGLLPEMKVRNMNLGKTFYVKSVIDRTEYSISFTKDILDFELTMETYLNGKNMGDLVSATYRCEPI